MKLEAGDSCQLVENMAVDVLTTGKVNQLSSIDKDVDAVTLDSVNKVHILVYLLTMYSCADVAVSWLQLITECFGAV